MNSGANPPVPAASPGVRRHTPVFPCPVCGGHDRLKRGAGMRCCGFTLDRVVYCTREERAGPLKIESSVSPPAFRHLRFGDCPCGAAHGAAASKFVVVRPVQGHCVNTRPDIRDAIYRDALDHLELRPEARNDLLTRGVPFHEIEGWHFKSLPRRGSEHAAFMAKMTARWGRELELCPGFSDKNHRTTFWSASGSRDGYLVPFVDEEGRIIGLQAKVLGGKYLTATGMKVSELYCVAGTRTDVLYVTEGGLKAIVSSVVGAAWVLGVAGLGLSATHVQVIKSLGPSRVAVAVDREDNAASEAARRSWASALLAAGLDVYEAVWEPGL